MLKELYVRDVALIRELRIEFEKGFNVLTGETGAGKSIVVDSMGLVLGDRGRSELIRYGTQAALVEAYFVAETEEAAERLRQLGIEDGEFSVSRELSASGKNTCRINGRQVPLAQMREAVSGLTDLHGQNENQEIYSTRRQLDMLDRYAGDADILEETSEKYAEYREIREELEKLARDAGERDRLLDILAYQIREIEAAELKPGEEEQLSAQRMIMRNSEKISDAIVSAYREINGEGDAAGVLSRAAKDMGSISSYDQRFAGIESLLNDAYYSAKEASEMLSEMRDEFVFEPDELERVEDRLSVIRGLNRKYGGDIPSVLAFLEEAKTRQDSLLNAEDRTKQLKEELGQREKRLADVIGRLRDARKKAGEKLSAELVRELNDLGMKDARFHVEFGEKEPSRDGADTVEYYISVNAGEPEKPLSKVASGGEASRIMLAVQNIFADREVVDTIIFDEIDTGISGRMAVKVSEKLANISRKRQVICVSHLPQIAAMGDVNFEVVKTGDETYTRTDVKRLDKRSKIEAVARLAGGSATETAVAHAEELIESCDAYKQSI